MPRDLIRRLYESDAGGIVDEDLVDEVAFAFYARCESIIKATSAYLGHATCAACSQTIEHRHRAAEVLLCPACGWTATWGDYRRSYHGKYLITGNPGGAFSEYMRRLEAARTPREKMLAVDWMVHQVHSWSLQREAAIGRPAAISLIEGTETKVVAFLDELANGPASTPESQRAHATWRRRLYLGSER